MQDSTPPDKHSPLPAVGHFPDQRSVSRKRTVSTRPQRNCPKADSRFGGWPRKVVGHNVLTRCEWVRPALSGAELPTSGKHGTKKVSSAKSAEKGIFPGKMPFLFGKEDR